MKSSIPDHRLDTAIWRFTPAQHFACFQRQLRSLGVSHQHYTLHGLAGHWLQYRGLPQLRRRGRWTSERTLEIYIQEPVSVLWQISHIVSWQNKTTKGPPPSPTATHVATERGEASAPICAAASSNRVLPAPSCLSEHLPYL